MVEKRGREEASTVNDFKYSKYSKPQDLKKISLLPLDPFNLLNIFEPKRSTLGTANRTCRQKRCRDRL